MNKQSILIGTSGWSYDHWINNFYPENIPKNQWISHYSSCFHTVELNMSFYRTPFPNMVKGWINKTPDNFIFSIKASRFITHIKRLTQIEESMAKLYQLADSFHSKCRAVLFQLPPSFHNNEHNLNKLIEFVRLFNPCYDNAVEFRHPSWWNNKTYESLAGKAAFCIINGLNMPRDFIATHNVLYFRFHGNNYNSLYTNKDLNIFLDNLMHFIDKNKIKRTYIYFNNDLNGYAVINAKYLKKLLSDK